MDIVEVNAKTHPEWLEEIDVLTLRNNELVCKQIVIPIRFAESTGSKDKRLDSKN